VATLPAREPNESNAELRYWPWASAIAAVAVALNQKPPLTRFQFLSRQFNLSDFTFLSIHVCLLYRAMMGPSASSG